MNPKGIVDLKRMHQGELIEYTLELQDLLQKGIPMLNDRTAWVTADGTYGEDDIILFHPDALTDEQYEFMHNMRDNDRYAYTQAVLEGDLETVAEFHHEYED